jgi:hypothetical protein
MSTSTDTNDASGDPDTHEDVKDEEAETASQLEINDGEKKSSKSASGLKLPEIDAKGKDDISENEPADASQCNVSNAEEDKAKVQPHFYSQDSADEPTAGSSQDEKGNGSAEGSAVTKVASHYNAIEEIGIRERTKSRIFFLRNFNNWVKSTLIGEKFTSI